MQAPGRSNICYDCDARGIEPLSKLNHCRSTANSSVEKPLKRLTGWLGEAAHSLINFRLAQAALLRGKRTPFFGRIVRVLIGWSLSGPQLMSLLKGLDNSRTL